MTSYLNHLVSEGQKQSCHISKAGWFDATHWQNRCCVITHHSFKMTCWQMFWCKDPRYLFLQREHFLCSFPAVQAAVSADSLHGFSFVWSFSFTCDLHIQKIYLHSIYLTHFSTEHKLRPLVVLLSQAVLIVSGWKLLFSETRKTFAFPYG